MSLVTFVTERSGLRLTEGTGDRGQATGDRAMLGVWGREFEFGVWSSEFRGRSSTSNSSVQTPYSKLKPAAAHHRPSPKIGSPMRARVSWLTALALIVSFVP